MNCEVAKLVRPRSLEPFIVGSNPTLATDLDMIN